MMRSADVVVIGAGIIGCSAAYFLAADGHRVVIVDRGEVASGTAAASGGWIIIHDKETPAGVALALESRRLYERMAADAGVAVHSHGGLILAATSAELDRLRHQVEIATAGGARVDLLDGPALLDLEPEVARDLAGATYCPDEATADAPQVCQAIIAAIRARGVGTCLVGSSREFKGEDRTVDADLAERMKQRAAMFVPALRTMRPTRVTVGLRPYTSLGRPIIGWAGPDGFLVATGHEGQGITLAPVTGKLVSDLVAGRAQRTGFELSP